MWIFLNIGAGIIIFIMLPAIVFHHTESGWTYLDSVYYSVVSISTIGFGDFINGQNGGGVKKILGNWMLFYRAFTILWLVSGLSFIFMVNTLILDRIRKMTSHTELKSVIIHMKNLKKGISRRGREDRKRVRKDQGRNIEDRERNKEDQERNIEDREMNKEVRERNRGDIERNKELAEQHKEDKEIQKKDIVGEENIETVNIKLVRSPSHGKMEREGVRLKGEEARIEREGARIQREGERIEKEGVRLEREGVRLEREGERLERGEGSSVGERTESWEVSMEGDGGRMEGTGQRKKKL